MRGWTALAGWVVLLGAVAWAVKVSDPHPADDEKAREHPDAAWDRHVAEMAAVVARESRGQGTETEWHSVTCPCALCTTYQPHEIENNHYPPLRVVREEPRAHDH